MCIRGVPHHCPSLETPVQSFPCRSVLSVAVTMGRNTSGDRCPARHARPPLPKDVHSGAHKPLCSPREGRAALPASDGALSLAGALGFQ